MGEVGVYCGSSNLYLKKNDFGWEIDLVGFCFMLREIYDCY